MASAAPVDDGDLKLNLTPYYSACSLLELYWPHQKKWSQISILGDSLGLSAHALAGLARPLGYRCELFRPIQDELDYVTVGGNRLRLQQFSRTELAPMIVRSICLARDEEELFHFAGLLGTNLFALVEVGQRIGLTSPVTEQLALRWADSSRGHYVLEQKLMVKKLYSSCRTLEEKQELADRLGIDSMAKLYNLASRMKATGTPESD